MNIEKNIPMPERSGTPTYRDTIAKMVEGDSVLFEKQANAKGFARAIRDMGFYAIVDWHAKGGTRVWKGAAKTPPNQGSGGKKNDEA